MLGSEELDAVAAVLGSGRLVQGQRVAEFEELLAATCRRTFAVAVASGTAALSLALQAAGVGSGDEVLCPDLSWPSPAHAIIRCGASPVLVDVDRHEWNALPAAFAEARTDRTRAAVVIDQFGVPARVTEIQAALGELPLIVDAACSLGSSLHGEPCGSMGLIACLSFHPRKLLTTGEGGACLTDQPELAHRLTVLRNHGQSAPGRFREPAGNFRLTEMAAAMGSIQLGRLDAIVARRRALSARYRAALGGLEFQRAPAGAEWNVQTMGALLPRSASRRASVLEQLRARNVEAGMLSYAMHSLPQLAQASQLARQRGRSFPNAQHIAEYGIALPLYPTLQAGEQQLVIDAVAAVLGGGAGKAP